MVKPFMMHPCYIIICTTIYTSWSCIALHIFSNSVCLLSVVYNPKRLSDKSSVLVGNIELIELISKH